MSDYFQLNVILICCDWLLLGLQSRRCW